MNSQKKMAGSNSRETKQKGKLSEKPIVSDDLIRGLKDYGNTVIPLSTYLKVGKEAIIKYCKEKKQLDVEVEVVINDCYWDEITVQKSRKKRINDRTIILKLVS